jgi:hypothetical protein
MKKHITFTDGEERNRQHPDTFPIPTTAQKQALQIGESVQIGVEGLQHSRPIAGERFWVRLTSVEGDTYSGTVRNDLAFSEEHGVKHGDLLTFEARHILDVDPANAGTEAPQVYFGRLLDLVTAASDAEKSSGAPGEHAPQAHEVSEQELPAQNTESVVAALKIMQKGPLGPKQLLALGRSIAETEWDGGNALSGTTAFLQAHELPMESTMRWLADHGITSDAGVAAKLFAPLAKMSENLLSRMLPASGEAVVAKKTKGARNAEVARYALAFYSDGGCTLCGNSGIIDTTGTRLPRGQFIGRRQFCICPNGQRIRWHYGSVAAYDKRPDSDRPYLRGPVDSFEHAPKD